MDKGSWTIEVIRRSDNIKGFKVLPRRWVVETLTLLAGSGVPDADFDAARSEFSETEMAALTVAVGTMNLWNRLGLGAQMPA